MALSAERGNFPSTSATEMPQKCHSETHEHTHRDGRELSDTYQLSCLPLAVKGGNERGRQRERREIQKASKGEEEKKALVAVVTETCRVG